MRGNFPGASLDTHHLTGGGVVSTTMIILIETCVFCVQRCGKHTQGYPYAGWEKNSLVTEMGGDLVGRGCGTYSLGYLSREFGPLKITQKYFDVIKFLMDYSCCCCRCCFKPWPTVREVCQNNEVAMLQTWTVKEYKDSLWNKSSV